MSGGWLLALAIAVAGGLGATARYVVDTAVAARLGEGQPWGTFAVNVSGSWALGLVVGLSPGTFWTGVLGVGLLGGYTTFSTAMLHAVQDLESGRALRGGLLAAGTVLACVAAAALGVLLSGVVDGR